MRPKFAYDLQPGDYIGEQSTPAMIVAALQAGGYVFCYTADDSLIRLPANLRLMVWDNELERQERAATAEVERRQREANQRRAEMARRLQEFDREFVRVERQRRLEACGGNGAFEVQPEMGDMLEKRWRLWSAYHAIV